MDAPAAQDDPLSRFLSRALAQYSGKGALYLRLAEALSLAITGGLMPDGSPLPSERALTAATGLSRVTVRAAVDKLVQDGLITRRQGARSTITARIEKTPELSGFSQEMRARGRTPSSRWLGREIAPATLAEALALGLEAGDAVARLSRLRCADGAPIALEEAALPAALLPDPMAVGESLYDHLADSGIRPHHGFQRLRAALPDGAEAELLGLAPGAPILAFERRTFLADGRALEFTRTRYSGAAYEYVTQLALPQAPSPSDMPETE